MFLQSWRNYLVYLKNSGVKFIISKNINIHFFQKLSTNVRVLGTYMNSKLVLKVKAYLTPNIKKRKNFASWIGMLCNVLKVYSYLYVTPSRYLYHIHLGNFAINNIWFRVVEVGVWLCILHVHSTIRQIYNDAPI